MPEIVQGVVLDTVKFKENSTICKLFTKQHGLLTLLLNGVGSKKTGLSYAYLQPLTHVECIVYVKERKSIFRASDFVILKSPFGPIPNIGKTSISVFVAEVVLRTFKEESHVEENVFLLLEEIIDNLLNPELNINGLHLYFLCVYVDLLGFSFEYESLSLKGAHKEHEVVTLFYELPKIGRYTYFELPRQLRKKILNYILQYMQDKLEMPKLKSLEILEMVMS